MVVLLEIAIVLCSLFLVALPVTAIAAEEDDYVLDIYGNANEDDTIDMRDLTYVKLIFFGKKPETELADAKYDGKINPLDFIQIKLIIVGKEKELTIEIPADFLQAAQIITVHKPVERIVLLAPTEAEVLRSINAADKIVGVGSYIGDDEVFFPTLSKLPIVGEGGMPMGLNYEAILNQNPDVLLVFVRDPRWVDEEKLPGVTVIGLSLRYPADFTERVRLLGYILDKEEEAEEYINWHDGYMDKIKSRTEGLSEDQKPRVFPWALFRPGDVYRACPKRTRYGAMSDIAGGINIGGDLKGTWPMVDPEWVIVQNPDIVVIHAWRTRCGYAVDDPSEMAAIREEILNRPELANLNAVKTGSVYLQAGPEIGTAGSGCFIGIAYLAKWFHPDLFKDLDPQAIHQEYIDRFQRIDYDLDEHGVLVYPPLED